MTARETLAFVARFFYTGREHIARRVDESLRLVSLKAKADRPISGFSGGELQRLGIAQAQINEPELLILDEPSSSLDPMGRAEVLAIIDRLRERSTVFYSTHILDDIERVSDHVIILNRGKLVAQGPITDILAVDSEVSYDVELNGPSSDLRIDLLTIPWVTKVERVGQNGHTRWRIAVSSAELAERDLMRQMMSADGVQIVSFARRQRSMEDAFMQMIGETNHE